MSKLKCINRETTIAPHRREHFMGGRALGENSASARSDFVQSKAEIRFSVIIPTFNSAGWIERAIYSALSQEFPPFEIMVIDDGSTDETAQLVGYFQNQVLYIRLRHTGFPGTVRNQGLLRCRGTHVAFLDADDAWYPNKLAMVVEASSRNPEAGVIYSDFTLVDENLTLQRRVRCPDISRAPYNALLHANYIATSTAVIKRECFAACGTFREDIRTCEDWDLWTRISRQFQFIHIALPLAQYTTYSVPRSLISSSDHFHNQCRVAESIFGTDPTITARQKRRILSWLHYRAGRVDLLYHRDREAVRHFMVGLRYCLLHWRSWAFLVFMVARSLRHAAMASIGRRRASGERSQA